MKEVRFLGLGKGLFFMKRKFRNPVEMVTRIATLAILSALGFVLMAFLQFPYPFAPWLKIEVSEIVTVLAYALYGLPGGITVAIIKTLLNLAVHGPVGLGIGDLTAFITSCMYILGLFVIEHEATVSKISEDQLFYLMSRGISEKDATQMIIMGFIEPFSKELPMEYAVELNQLIKLDMEGSVG